MKIFVEFVESGSCEKKRRIRIRYSRSHRIRGITVVKSLLTPVGLGFIHIVDIDFINFYVILSNV